MAPEPLPLSQRGALKKIDVELNQRAPSPWPSPPVGARELTLIFSSPRLRFGGEGGRRAGEGFSLSGFESFAEVL